MTRDGYVNAPWWLPGTELKRVEKAFMAIFFCKLFNCLLFGRAGIT